MGHDCSPFHPFLSNAELTAWLVYFTVSPLRRRLYFETCCQVSFWALRWWESWQYCQLAIDVQMLWCKLEKRRCTDTSAQRTTGIAIQDHGKQQGQLQRPFQHVMREIVASSITWCLGIKGGGTATFAVGVKGWVICTTVTDRLGNDSTNFKNCNIRFLRSQQTEKAEREWKWKKQSFLLLSCQVYSEAEWVHYGAKVTPLIPVCSKYVKASQINYNRLQLFGLALVFYDRIHKHEYFSCYKTFPPMEQRLGKEG